MSEPKFFPTANSFRTWLEKNHDEISELLVGFHKVDSGKASMTWSESVDEALCFGWIDGVRKRVDDDSYTIRFSPRRPSSIWSAINIKKVEKLSESGLMRPAGVAASGKRDKKKSAIYSYETGRKNLRMNLKRDSGKIKKRGASSRNSRPVIRRLCLLCNESQTRKNQEQPIRTTDPGKQSGEKIMMPAASQMIDQDRRLDPSASPHQLQHQHDDRNDQKDVDQATDRLTRESET